MAQASEMAQSTVDLVMPFSWISIPTPKCPLGCGRWVESFPPLYTKETNVNSIPRSPRDTKTSLSRMEVDR